MHLDSMKITFFSIKLQKNNFFNNTFFFRCTQATLVCVHTYTFPHKFYIYNFVMYLKGKGEFDYD